MCGTCDVEVCRHGDDCNDDMKTGRRDIVGDCSDDTTTGIRDVVGDRNGNAKTMTSDVVKQNGTKLKVGHDTQSEGASGATYRPEIVEITIPFKFGSKHTKS